MSARAAETVEGGARVASSRGKVPNQAKQRFRCLPGRDASVFRDRGKASAACVDTGELWSVKELVTGIESSIFDVSY